VAQNATARTRQPVSAPTWYTTTSSTSGGVERDRAATEACQIGKVLDAHQSRHRGRCAMLHVRRITWGSPA
jgi:hypothetical protein